MEDAGNPIPPEALDALKHELLFSAPTANPGGRFKKGQSGNPKGRPKRGERVQPALPVDGILGSILAEANRKVAVRENGKVSHISAREGVSRALYATAVKGHPYALRTTIDMLLRGEQAQAREIAEDHAFWEDYRVTCWAEIAHAKRTGKPEPNCLPHPDDIVIELGKKVRFTGPVDEADIDKLHQSCRLRDALMMQDALDQRLAATTGKTPGGALLIAQVLNLQLPQRMQLSDGAMVSRLMGHEATAKRLLLKALFQAWQSLGVSVPRGWTFPSLDRVEGQLQFYLAFFSAAQSGELDVSAMARGEFDEGAREFLATWA